MNAYQRAIICLITRRPKKLFTLLRLALGAKIFAIKRKFGLLKKNNTGSPITIIMRVTYRCNLRCVHCGQWGRKGVLNTPESRLWQERRELSTPQLKTFLKEISRFKPYVLFTGGEPFMREDIIELLEYAADQNLLTGISTNATLIEDKADRIVNSGVDYLFASLDGPESVNNSIRIGDDSYARAMGGIRAVTKARKKHGTRLPIIQIHTTITEENQYHLLETATLIEKEIDAEVFGIAPGIFTTEALNKASKEIYRKNFTIEERFWDGFVRNTGTMDVKAIEEQIEQIKKRKWRFKVRLYSPIDYKDFNFYEYFNKPEKIFGDASCVVPYLAAQFQPNGDIATCGCQPDYISGSILKKCFLDIWNGSEYQRFRESVQKNAAPACSRCGLNYEYYK